MINHKVHLVVMVLAMGNTPKDGNYLLAEIGQKSRDWDEAGFDFSLLDQTNERSLISIIGSDVLKDLILALPKDYLVLPEKELSRKVKIEYNDIAFRLRFWDEYVLAQKDRRQMKMTRVYAGICTIDYFYARLRREPKVLALMIRPPVDFITNARAMLEKGIEQSGKILRMSVYDKVPVLDKGGRIQLDGEGKAVYRKQINPKVMGEIRQITQWLHTLVHGAVVQRLAIKQESTNTNLNLNAEAPATYSMSDLQKLESQLTRIEGQFQTIEGEVVEPEQTTEVQE